MRQPLSPPVDAAWHWMKPDLQIVDFWLSRVNRLWSTHEPRARLVGRHIEADGITTLTLKPNRHFKGFKAGQHINVSVEIDGVRHTRSYSASDRPQRDRLIRITVKAIGSGKVSGHLQHLPLGSVLPIGQAFGTFELPDAEGQCLLLAAGTGITPMLSLLKAQAALAFPRPITLAYWARTRREWVQADVLHAWSKLHANFKLRLIATGESKAEDNELTGRINPTHLQDCLPDGERAHALVCGSNDFVSAARALIEPTALSVQAESFTPPVRDAQGVVEAGTVKVTLLRSGKTVEVPRGQALLDALEAQGVSPAYGCRMGICNTCACGKAEGSSRDLRNQHIDEEPNHALRLCISAAHSDLALEL